MIVRRDLISAVHPIARLVSDVVPRETQRRCIQHRDPEVRGGYWHTRDRRRRHNAATAELAVAGTGAASSLMLALSSDARGDGSWPVYLAFGAISGLLATHAAWVLAHGERPAVEAGAGEVRGV